MIEIVFISNETEFWNISRELITILQQNKSDPEEKSGHRRLYFCKSGGLWV